MYLTGLSSYSIKFHNTVQLACVGQLPRAKIKTCRPVMIEVYRYRRLFISPKNVDLQWRSSAVCQCVLIFEETETFFSAIHRYSSIEGGLRAEWGGDANCQSWSPWQRPCTHIIPIYLIFIERRTACNTHMCCPPGAVQQYKKQLEILQTTTYASAIHVYTSRSACSNTLWPSQVQWQCIIFPVYSLGREKNLKHRFHNQVFMILVVVV